MTSTRQITILYGSQTGCSQEVAERVSREAKRRHFLDDIQKEETVIFICSTTGQGETPDNMKKFWRYLLLKSHPSDFLKNMQYAVYGLGDSSYPQFCWVAKKLKNRLNNLGATQVIDPSYGDDQSEHGIDDTLNPWLEELWKMLMEKFPLLESQQVISADKLEPPFYEILKIKHRSEPIQTYNSKLVVNQRITPLDHWQDVRHVVFDISNSNITYESGDVLGIKPKNTDLIVQAALKRFGYDPQEIVSIPKLGIYDVSYYELFENHIDIQGTPKKRFFEITRHLSRSEMEREKLDSLSKETEELYKYAIREKKPFLEVLEEFPELVIPEEYLFDLIPLIQPRYFSISSSQLVTPKEIHITVALVSFKTPYRRQRHGFCSKWLSELTQADTNVFVRKGSIRLPENDKIPIVMIGPGTGMAPFKSFALTRMIRSLDHQVGNTTLFFGNRNENKDYFYRSEFEGMESKYNFKMITAFSRDQDEKIYVQDKIRQNAEIILDCLQNQGVIFVAGNAKKMPRDIREAIVDCIVLKGLLNKEDALKFMLQLENKARYQCETWH